MYYTDTIFITDTPMTPTENKQDALAFLRSQKTGVLATVSASVSPRARIVYYSCDDSFNIYFLTLKNTGKAEDISHNPHVAFVAASENVPQTIQIEGTAKDQTDSAINDPVVRQLFLNLQSNSTYHAPIERLDAGDVVFYRITPTKITWGNFTSGRGSSEVFTHIIPE